jgi:Flp pilus assembly protein TadD
MRLCFLALVAWASLAPLAQAQEATVGNAPGTQLNATKLDEPEPEKGWDALARLLHKASPSVNTALDPTPSQITTYIEGLLTKGRNKEALAAIEKREADLAAHPRAAGGTDVQLQFQHARALAALNRGAEARDVYIKMTTLYPELPEPWNNLAVLYVAQGDLQQAADALAMALRADPEYVTARANLGDVQTMMAQSNYRKAGRSGALDAGSPPVPPAP